MSLIAGSRLGQYEIVTLLGSGGMGDVYRAHDTKLGRDVALKILPESVVHDPDRVARFRREAQVLASLNHPHIAAIYGLEEANGSQFLVLELVEGETLAEKLASGSGLQAPDMALQRDSGSGPKSEARSPKRTAGLPVSESLAIARQIVEALEAAH